MLNFLSAAAYRPVYSGQCGLNGKIASVEFLQKLTLLFLQLRQGRHLREKSPAILVVPRRRIGLPKQGPIGLNRISCPIDSSAQICDGVVRFTFNLGLHAFPLTGQ